MKPFITFSSLGLILNIAGSALLDATWHVSHTSSFGWSDWGFTGWSLRVTGCLFVATGFTLLTSEKP